LSIFVIVAIPSSIHLAQVLNSDSEVIRVYDKIDEILPQGLA
jgi:hypothetical protein